MHLSRVEDTALLLYECVGGDAADLCALNFTGSSRLAFDHGLENCERGCSAFGCIQ
jgi:hypothetical protein